MKSLFTTTTNSSSVYTFQTPCTQSTVKLYTKYMHVFLISPVTIIIKEDDVSQDEIGSFHTKTTNAFEVVKLTMRTTCNGVNLCMMHHKYMLFLSC
mmetsp:Transcript_38634/g.62419  ORF Transcript_38634/g.62419 Transcript_38634/m.62419 type:complete len:96 (+) Transcript_38634:121-408(+)